MRQPVFENRVALMQEMQKAVVGMLQQSSVVCLMEHGDLSWVSYEEPIELCDGSKVYHITLVNNDGDTDVTIGCDEANASVIDFVDLEPCVAVDLMCYLFGMYYEM